MDAALCRGGQCHRFMARLGTKLGSARGAIAATSSAGVLREDVQAHGGWRSEAVDRYILLSKKRAVGTKILLQP